MIEVIAGCMYAGKTSELVRRLSGIEAVAFKPSIDARYHDTHLATHDGVTFPAITIPTSSSGLDMILERAKGVKVVGIDECQFLPESLVLVVNVLADRGVRVICSGLDLDYKGQPFGPMPALMAIADSVKKITAKCKCGARANRTYKLTRNTELIEVGSHGVYEARCRTCWSHHVG
jgi:thymidine kinase